MPFLTHEIEIRRGPAVVFEACRNVERWAGFMPAVRTAAFLERSERSDVVSICAEANDQLWTWCSRRTIDVGTLTITFDRLDPPPPLTFVRGIWHVSAVDRDNVRLSLSHEFGTIDCNGDMESFFERSVRANATRDLRALKEHLESTERPE